MRKKIIGILLLIVAFLGVCAIIGFITEWSFALGFMGVILVIAIIAVIAQKGVSLLND